MRQGGGLTEEKGFAPVMPFSSSSSSTSSRALTGLFLGKKRSGGFFPQFGAESIKVRKKRDTRERERETERDREREKGKNYKEGQDLPL